MKLKFKPKARMNFLVIFLAVGLAAASASYSLATSQKNNKIAADSCPVEHCVELTGSGAKPDEIYVKIGAHVQFNSADGNSHELSLGKGGEEHSHSGPFHSGEFQADEAWRTKFDEAGTFFFHDHFNPGINVLVVVYGSDNKIE